MLEKIGEFMCKSDIARKEERYRFCTCYVVVDMLHIANFIGISVCIKCAPSKALSLHLVT